MVHKKKHKKKKNKSKGAELPEDRQIESTEKDTQDQNDTNELEFSAEKRPINDEDSDNEDKPKKKKKKKSTEIKTQEENDTSELDLDAETRPINEDDSDNEDKPKKKKKKKQIDPTETDNKKGKKSIRQMKREKHAQRMAEAQSVAKDQLKSQCLNYLSQWKHDRQNWKFMKIKQGWLFKNKFSSSLIPDSSWPVFLEYFESAKGVIKNHLLEDANKIINQMDEWTESQNAKKGDSKSYGDDEGDGNEQEVKSIEKPDETAYKRARDIIQCLQD